MECSLHQLQMCERGAVTQDVSCISGRQSSTAASHQSTVRFFWTAQYSMVSDCICKLWSCRG